MSEELIDIYDSRMVPIGVVTKDEAHSGGYYHKSFHCWIVNRAGRVLLQKRSADKKVFKGLFDVSAAGHYKAGESGLDGAREVKEELGFQPDAAMLTEVCVFTDEYVAANYTNREFCMVYAYRSDIPLNAYELNGEADGLASVELDKLAELFDGKTDTVRAEYFDKKTNSLTAIELKTSDFIPSPSGYYGTVLKKLLLTNF